MVRGSRFVALREVAESVGMDFPEATATTRKLPLSLGRVCVRQSVISFPLAVAFPRPRCAPLGAHPRRDMILSGVSFLAL